MAHFPLIKPMGERAILIEFEPEINGDTLKKVLAIRKFLQEKTLKEEVELTNTYHSLLITYHSSIEDVYSEVLSLEEEISKANIHFKFESSLFHIPVCYDDKFALDLSELSEVKNLQKEEIIQLHSETEYMVYFTGFLPGFLYLGGLPEKLHFPRKKQPRLEVPKGAVGIGEKQTGIYPQKSPGGWNIIGNSPVPLFDPEANPPCEISAGDFIRFYPVSLEEHREILKEVENGEFRYRKEEHNG